MRCARAPANERAHAARSRLRRTAGTHMLSSDSSSSSSSLPFGSRNASFCVVSYLRQPYVSPIPALMGTPRTVGWQTVCLEGQESGGCSHVLSRVEIRIANVH